MKKVVDEGQMIRGFCKKIDAFYDAARFWKIVASL